MQEGGGADNKEGGASVVLIFSLCTIHRASVVLWVSYSVQVLLWKARSSEVLSRQAWKIFWSPAAWSITRNSMRFWNAYHSSVTISFTPMAFLSPTPNSKMCNCNSAKTNLESCSNVWCSGLPTGCVLINTLTSYHKRGRALVLELSAGYKNSSGSCSNFCIVTMRCILIKVEGAYVSVGRYLLKEYKKFHEKCIMLH